MPDNVITLNRVQEFLEGLIAERPLVIMLAYKSSDADEDLGERGRWTTAVARDGTDDYPYEEMIGVAEVLKAQLLDRYFETTELTEHVNKRKSEQQEEE